MYYKQYIILKQICQQIFHKMYELTLFDGICVKPLPNCYAGFFARSAPGFSGLHDQRFRHPRGKPADLIFQSGKTE